MGKQWEKSSPVSIFFDPFGSAGSTQLQDGHQQKHFQKWIKKNFSKRAIIQSQFRLKICHYKRCKLPLFENIKILTTLNCFLTKIL